MKSLALFGGSFNPPGEHHRAIAKLLTKHFDQVVIVPCGPRPDKPVTNDVEPIYRSAMVDMAFRSIRNVRIELFDLEAETFTRTFELDRIFRVEGEVWHVVGADLIRNGGRGKSFIQTEWKQGRQLWKEASFAVLKRPGYELANDDLPPSHRVFEIELEASSSQIRDKVFHHETIEGLVSQEVKGYIERHGLYRGTRTVKTTHFQIAELRPLIVHDELNPETKKLARYFTKSHEDNPNLIIVVGGDGAMLRAIRRHWRRRVPFYGVNAGHMGFLLNPPARKKLTERPLTLHQLPLLRVETQSPTGQATSDLAFNDAWVERSTGQTAWIEVSVDGKVRVEQLMADGVLVSTAAGSASYARAMGAHPLPFTTSILLLVGSNVLRPPGWRSAVLPIGSEVQFRSLDPEKRPLNGYLDGISQGKVSVMKIRVSNVAAVELAFEPEYDPTVKLAQIQFPT